MKEENILLTNKHILLCNLEQIEKSAPIHFTFNANELGYIKENFCGLVVSNTNQINNFKISSDVDIYICGDIQTNMNIIEGFENFAHSNTIYIISEFSWNWDNYLNDSNIRVINSGMVPINVHGVGVYFRNCFTSNGINYFDSIVREHQFQSLTESNKQSNAFRTGIYITKVEPDLNEPENLNWHLLRCSSNLSGPSDNTKETDNKIISQTNQLATKFFKSQVSMNHVLAQIYTNSTIQTDDGRSKETKAKIKTHSDKTKDMPTNGLMGFCSFYQGYGGEEFNSKYKKSSVDTFDYVLNKNSNTSVLTRLKFRLKTDIPNTNNQYTPQFDIILYPNSVFIMSLMTNRIYTHEIVPSGLPVDKIPTRMGYVIRCSNTLATHKDGHTYLNKENKLIEMEEPDEEGITRLKDLYYKENMTSEKVVYSGFNFSLNKGDYSKPLV